ncbi:MAG: prolyl-tRNA synthetase associated domain-containing protein [Candidatus Vogelbacteria bacterium]|nr:prolyl-tRNA synthetase associated domain-containing protein [Candidatus Vogelbacteria bacterium]
MYKALEYLDSRKIKYILYEHEAVFTCEAADRVCAMIPGTMCKNLFLTDRKSGKFYLVTLPVTKRLDIKALTKRLAESSMRFGNSEELMAKLGLLPGSVSPLGLINNKDNDVTFILDSEIGEAETVSIHPNVNTASLTISKDNFRKMYEGFKNRYSVLDL